MSTIQYFLASIKQILDFPVMKFGNTQITPWGIILFAVLSILLFYSTARLKTWIVERLLAKSRLDLGLRYTVGTIVRYTFIAIGFTVILQTAGIDLSALAIVIGSLSIGIGLGLQGITNNFVSGMILLFERPIKVGDRIEFGGLSGDVVRIAARATTLLTNDNIAVIVPNSELTSSAVINWTYPNRKVRFNFPVGVSYDSDPEFIRTLLLEVASENSNVLKDPPPDVLFAEFGESSLNFILRVWNISHADRPGVLRSEINFGISKKFKEHHVEVPFPQRDLHIKSNGQEAATLH